jgi:protein TonB
MSSVNFAIPDFCLLISHHETRVSGAGTISNLRVIGGPALLQLPALDAVKTWRYRPYIFNGYPAEFQTTVKVTSV